MTVGGGLPPPDPVASGPAGSRPQREPGGGGTITHAAAVFQSPTSRRRRVAAVVVLHVGWSCGSRECAPRPLPTQRGQPPADGHAQRAVRVEVCEHPPPPARAAVSHRRRALRWAARAARDLFSAAAAHGSPGRPRRPAGRASSIRAGPCSAHAPGILTGTIHAARNAVSSRARFARGPGRTRLHAPDRRRADRRSAPLA
jgi:hypothetical protein